MIKEFQGEFRFLSNFWYSEFIIDISSNLILAIAYPERGKPFPASTVEHAYQASKFLGPDQTAVLNCDTPQAAKRLGRKLTLRPDWGIKYQLAIMAELQQLKYSQNDWLRKKLLDTGNEVIVEGNKWHDTFWGVCHCPKHNSTGKNNMGKILMNTRERLRE